jgi:hypothetical protein
MEIRIVVFMTQKKKNDSTSIYSCLFAHLVWHIVHVTFSLTPPTNITNMFGNWLNGVNKKTKSQIRMEVCALSWAIWNLHNDIIFKKTRVVHSFHIIPMAIH